MSYGLDPQTNVLKIIEENGYYAYGLKHTSYNTDKKGYDKNAENNEILLKQLASDDGGNTTAQENINKYKFNGVEYQNELGLNLYDMDMRDYDPAIARWTGVDPITHFSQSPYNAFDSNPIVFADPSGADSIIYGMAGQTANANQWNQGHSSFGNSNFGNGLPDPFAENFGSAWGDGGLLSTIISDFISNGLSQVVGENEEYESSLKIFSSSQDIDAINYLIENSENGYGDFIEMAGLVTENSTFIFSDTRNTSVNSYIDTKLFRAILKGNKTYANDERIIAAIHTHNEHSELSPDDFKTSFTFRAPVYALDINTGNIGRGFDFKKTGALIKYGDTAKINTIYSLKNGNFNIREDAKKVLLQVGFY